MQNKAIPMFPLNSFGSGTKSLIDPGLPGSPGMDTDSAY